MRYHPETKLTGAYDATVDEHERVIRQIEHRAQDLMRQLGKLESRWNQRNDKLQRHMTKQWRGDFYKAYDWRDLFC